MDISFRTVVTGKSANLSLSIGLDLVMANMRLFGKYQGYVLNLAKLFIELIANGFTI